jgi:hypothetical protein
MQTEIIVSNFVKRFRLFIYSNVFQKVRVLVILGDQIRYTEVHVYLIMALWNYL